MTRNVNIWNRLDRVSILIFLMLIIMGWFNIYAAVYNEEHTRILDLSQRYGKQFIWIIAAIILAIFIAVIDTRFYFFFAYFVYGGLILLLVAVLFLGKDVNGARSWFELGALTIQPSEFAKFGTALALAAFLNTRNHELKRVPVFFISTAIILFPALLIALQPDMGSTIVFIALFLVLYREGMSSYVFISGILMIILFFFTLLFNNLYLSIILIGIAFMLAWFATRKWKPLLAGLIIFVSVTAVLYVFKTLFYKNISEERLFLLSVLVFGVISAYYFYSKKAVLFLTIYLFLLGSLLLVNSVDLAFNRMLKPHQKERVEITLGIKSDPHGTGYNVNQSIISIGSGGFAGKGYLKGTQTKFKFVPAQSTDFIFCTVGEEWGFIGSFVVIGLYVFLILRLIILAERQRSVFSRIYGYGVVSILFIHFFINIGMAIGLVPVIGIPLPFLSYGGSSLWGFTILLFIFLRLDASRTEYLV
jgi:rod shape determining protein RodA